MNIAQLYPKKWLAPEDLAGRTVTVAIASVTLETVRNPRTNREENKLALAFHGKQKRLLINKTQAYALVAITGSEETDAWPGHLITLSVAVAHNGAKTFAITAPPDPPAPAPKPTADDVTDRVHRPTRPHGQTPTRSVMTTAATTPTIPAPPSSTAKTRRTTRPTPVATPDPIHPAPAGSHPGRGANPEAAMLTKTIAALIVLLERDAAQHDRLADAWRSVAANSQDPDRLHGASHLLRRHRPRAGRRRACA